MVVVAEDFPTERVTEAKTALEEDRMFIQEKWRLVEDSNMRPKTLTSDLDKSHVTVLKVTEDMMQKLRHLQHHVCQHCQHTRW